MKYYQIKTILLLFVWVTINVSAQTKETNFKHDISSEKKPWTDKPFYNNPNNFQFAIVSDRTGGHREGVFGKGLEKINMMYPEFVMSVGDLIEGYTKDNRLLNEQWGEFHGILDSLKTKFFYVAGNHDYSNTLMAEQWKERYGKDYYYFIYKDVLFLIANTNDGDGVLMSKDQIAFLKEVISQNTDVRWTMVFMHHPLWQYGDANGFDEVEEMLKDRPYTMFAGHTHRYLHEVRNDKNHYVLGTTGGGSELRGAKFGEFDHIGWVTMTDSGPKLTNLALSGIIDHDISNVNTAKLARELIQSTDFKPLVLHKDNERKVILSLHNPTNKTMMFNAQMYHHHQVVSDQSHFNIELEPQSRQQIEIKTKPLNTDSNQVWDPIELVWELGYTHDLKADEFKLSGSEVIDLNESEVNLQFTEQDIFLKNLDVTMETPYENMNIIYSINDSEPLLDNLIYNTSLQLNETTIISAALTDNKGYLSKSLSKTFKKVRPETAVKVRNLARGVEYKYYEGNFKKIPDFRQLKMIEKGFTLELDPDKIGKRLDHYAIQYDGYLKVEETGVYSFYLKSDDGANLYINGKLVIENDGSHDVTAKKGMIALKKGWHPVQIDYFEDYLGERLEVEFSGDNSIKKDVEFWCEK